MSSLLVKGAMSVGEHQKFILPEAGGWPKRGQEMSAQPQNSTMVGGREEGPYPWPRPQASFLLGSWGLFGLA